uniref:RecA family profile 1 domain-containing protein n=1 Tax=Timema bartmani TaxID=61472 RepID=A0A7R9HW34_9NEOP|nr:unnamed protein product [Timema bartmani]
MGHQLTYFICVTALDAEQVFAHKWCLLSVGCPKLDEFLGGGVAVRGITELAGESGSGKTQLCLQMCLSVQYPEINGGLSAGSVYINTEDIFPSRRLHQLIQKFPLRFHSEDTSIQFGNNIFIEHIADVESLKKCVFGQLPQLLAQKSVGLIVVDSIAGVFRADFEPRDSVSRAKEMRAVGGQLHRLAGEFRVAIICVNQVAHIFSVIGKYLCQSISYYFLQVTTVINNERSVGDNTGRKTVAALGLAWANMVTTRLQISRTNRSVTDAKGTSMPVRMLEIIFSPDKPPRSCHFVVTEAGVSAVSNVNE